MFDAEAAPEWVDSNKCYRCRADFGLFTRKVSYKTVLKLCSDKNTCETISYFSIIVAIAGKYFAISAAASTCHCLISALRTTFVYAKRVSTRFEGSLFKIFSSFFFKMSEIFQ